MDFLFDVICLTYFVYVKQILPRIVTAMLLGVCELQDSRQLDFSLFMSELFWIFISEYIFCKNNIFFKNKSQALV